MPFTVEQFIESAAESGLLTADELREYIDALPDDKKPADGETLAKKLVAEKKLTPFQAQHIWKGKGKGLVLGNYVISDKLGQGGMGMVFKAHHRLMKREVALKVLPPNVTKDETAVKRFLREVEAAAKLTHPNIVAAHDADQSNGAYYLIMEFVEGRDLSEIIRKQGPATVEQAVDFVLQAARGLEFAHKNGVIHRDIKPANLLLDRAGTIKILDMGLARIADDSVDAATQAGLTGTGTIMGTVDYMSPEQAEDTKHAGPQADIFSLGATLYFLLTGKPVVGGETIGKKLKMLMTGVGLPQSISAARPGVPAEVDAVFCKMTAHDVAGRYRSMTEVIADLEAVRAGELPAARSSAEVPGIRPVAAGRTEDSAMMSFLSNLGEEGATDGRTSVAPVVPDRPSSETFADSRGQFTRPALGRTRAFTAVLTQPQHRTKWIGGAAAALLLLIGLTIWSFSGSGGDAPGANNAAATVGDRPLSVVRTPAAGNPPGTNDGPATTDTGWIDLLPMIDPSRHSVAGAWEKTGGELTTEAAFNSRIVVPYEPKGDYEYRVTFTRQSGMHSVALIFAVDGGQATYELDAWGAHLAGVQLIDGLRLSENATRVENQQLANQKTYTALVRVSDGDVAIFLDGRQLARHRIAEHEFSLMEMWQLPNANTLGVGAFNSPTTFHRVEVRGIGALSGSTRGGLEPGR